MTPMTRSVRPSFATRLRPRPSLLGVAVAVMCAAVSATLGDAAARGSLAPLVPVNPTFVVSGHGWGHGIGMSQYGAYGYAQHDADYTDILAHYYPGTTLGLATISRVRVLLAQGRASLVVGSAAPLKLTDGTGKVRVLPVGDYTIGAGLRVALDAASPPQALPGPLVFAPAGAPLTLGGVRYRGSLQIAVVGGKLQAVNSVGVDAYVQGVVPREMPFSWPAAALQAQAVAARSYALANLKRGGSFDLYPDTRSQVYGGIGAETPATNAAVTTTAGEVVLFDQQVADTLYSSTSGGRTAAIEDVWPQSEPVPYLVSVPDPYDGVSPYHNWGPLSITAATLASRLHVPGKLVDLQVALNPSARVASVTAVGSAGKVTVTGAAVSAALGLRSSWFRFGMLGQLAAPVQPVVFGSKAKLSGVARSMPKLVVQARSAGGAWKVLAPVKPGPRGGVTVAVRPQVTTSYRLASGTVGGIPTRIAVSPRIRLNAVSTPGHLTGSARPLLTGSTVLVQRLSAASVWTTVATAPIDASGNFDAGLQLASGTYRASMTPGHGLAAGSSPPLEVTVP
jgi:stage II sporulation protein D